MASVVMQKFGGMIPRLSARLLAVGSATLATMSQLWTGELRPFRRAKEIFLPSPLPTSDIVRTIYLLADKWLAWTLEVDVASGFTSLAAAGQIYWTGDGAPKQSNYTLLVGGPVTPDASATFPLGVVGPPTFPIVSRVGSGPDAVTRVYVYTYYTRFNEESVPSPPSAPIDVGTGDSVDLTGFVIPTPPTTVDRIRIYRTVGGDFLFVTEFFTAAYSPPVNDALLDTDLAEPLQSQHYYPPPADLQGLIGLACGSLAAFHGNRVAFSEPYQPGAWPPEYEKIFDYLVVAIGTFGQTTVVATTGYTYLVSGSDPRSFSVARVPDPYSCNSKRSMVSTDNGCVYASDSGLIFVGNPTYSSGQASGVYVLTRSLLTRNEWLKYARNIIGAVFDGRYYGFYTSSDPFVGGAGFIYDFSNRLTSLITGVLQEDESDKTDILIELDFHASAVFANPTVPLYYVTQDLLAVPPVANHLFLWEGDLINFGVYTWRSKEFSFPYAITFSVAKLIFNIQFPKDSSYKFRIFDGSTQQQIYERVVNTDAPFRLPSLSPRTEWMFEVEGGSFVQMIQVASSYQDLMERKSG